MTNQTSEKHLNKVDVAKTQLDAAIQAYERGDDVIAVTLAGAAEEILGALCSRHNIKNAVETIAELPPLFSISDNLHKRINYLNNVRNCLKHANNPSEDIFLMADLDSFVIIVRALGNAKLLGVADSEAMSKFRSGDFLK